MDGAKLKKKLMGTYLQTATNVYKETSVNKQKERNHFIQMISIITTEISVNKQERGVGFFLLKSALFLTGKLV